MGLNVSPQQTEESNLQAAKRRAEREAVDYKQRVLRSAPVFLSYAYFVESFNSLERELERLHSRLERPLSVDSRTSSNSPRRR